MNAMEQLVKYISEWSNSVKRLNDLFYTDKARYSEKFYAEVLSSTYSLSLNNLNKIKANFPSIDLADTHKKICYQITSSYSKDKIDKTIKIFQEHNLDQKFETLVIFFMCDDKDRSDLNRTVGTTKLEVLSLHQLFKDIESLSPKKQYNLLNLLKSEFDDSADIRDRSFWLSRMSHQYPREIILSSGENTKEVNDFFNSRLVLKSYNDQFRRLLNNLLREIIQNTKKHGNPSMPEIRLVIERQKVTFYDWSKGFNPKKLAYLPSENPRRNFATHLYKELKRRLRGKFSCNFSHSKNPEEPNKTTFNFFEPLEYINLYEDCCIWGEEVGQIELYHNCPTVFFLPSITGNSSNSRDEFEYFCRKLKTGQKSGIALFESDKDKVEQLKRAFPDVEIKIVQKIRR